MWEKRTGTDFLQTDLGNPATASMSAFVDAIQGVTFHQCILRLSCKKGLHPGWSLPGGSSQTTIWWCLQHIRT